MSGIITKSNDLAGDNFSSVFSAIFGDQHVAAVQTQVEIQRTQYENVFGVIPADEYLLLTLLLNRTGPKRNSLDLDSMEWGLQNELCDIAGLNKKKDLTKYFSDYNFLLTLFTGVERIGSDGGGDGCLIGMAGDGVSHVVYRYNHEVGTIDDVMYGSINSLIASAFGVGTDADEDDGDGELEFEFPAGLGKSRDAVAAHIAKFNQKVEQGLAARPLCRDPLRLFERCHWLLQHTTGDPTFQFAAHMRTAPNFALWQQEREMLASEPLLANYWLLHHFFLGNRLALDEALEIVSNVREKEPGPGRVTLFLAEQIAKEIKKSTGLLGLDLETTNRLIAQTRQNADLALFEQTERAKIKIERGEDRIVRLNDAAFQKINTDPNGLWQAFQDYPEDVAGHDRILKALVGTAGQNQGLETAINDYLKERYEDAFNNWPADWQLKKGYKVDPRLSLPVSAAFVSGLKYSDEHEEAFCGVTVALGVFDDDHALRAFAQATERLPPDDDRAEYVFIGLRKSKHPRAPELLTSAAWRFFDNMQEAIRQEAALDAKRKKEGMTLDNMWGTENHFHMPLRTCLERSDEEAEKLARGIFGLSDHAQAFKMNFGRAIRVFGERGITEFNGEIFHFLKFIRDAKINEYTEMGLNTLFNLAEAAIALAKMEPEKARSIVPVLFARQTKSFAFDLDVKAALLGAMFVLNSGEPSEEPSGKPPEEPPEELKIWLRRLLGNRDNLERLVAVLRAAEVASLPESWPWVRYHIYSDTNSFMKYHELIKELAFVAAKALGQTDLPERERFSRYNSKASVEQQIQEIEQLHLHDPQDVLARIHKEKYQGPDAVAAIGDYLIDVLQFSSDETGTGFDAQWPGWKAMAVQGAAGQPALMELLKLEHCQPGLQNDAIFLMRLLEPEADFIVWLHEQSFEQLLEYLKAPETRTVGYLDLVAARAFLMDAEKARPAIESCLRWRFQWVGGHFYSEDPAVRRLIVLYARYGSRAHALLSELHTATEDDQRNGHYETARDLAEARDAARGDLQNGQQIEEPTSPLKLKWDDGTGKLELAVYKKNNVKIRFATEYSSYSGSFPNDIHESENLWELESDEAAKIAFAAILNLAVLLGYEMPVVTKSAPKKKSAVKKKSTTKKKRE